MPHPTRRPALCSRLALMGLALSAAVLGGAPGVRAQPSDGDPPRELVLTYSALLQEYASYRPVAPTAATDSTTDAGIERLEIDGIIGDQTLTRVGRDFYDAFIRLWRAPEGALNYALSIQEQPVQGFGTGVTVRVNDEVAFQARLTPRGDVIETAAQQAAALAARQLQRRTTRAGGD